MRLIIIPVDKFISIDDVGIHGADMSWIPEFTGESGISTSVHAVQWYGDHGEIELKSRDRNIVITELGVIEEAITKYQERKLEIVEQIRLEQIRLEQYPVEIQTNIWHINIVIYFNTIDNYDTNQTWQILPFN